MIATDTKTMTTTMSSPASSMQKPSKSILKPPTASGTATMLGQKRKRMDIDMSQSSTVSPGSSSPSSTPRRKKRARVTFEMDLPDQQQSQSASESQSDVPGEKSTAVVREEVRRAIQRHQTGDSDAYDRVKDVFAADPKELEDDGSPVYDLPSPTSLKNHLLALFSNVSALDGTCSGLVHAVLGSEWVGRDENYVRLFVRFLGTLAAARGGYLSSVLKMLTSGLRQVPPGVRKLPGYPTIRTHEVYSRIHFAIKYIIQLVPAGSGTLSPLLSHSFPNSTDTVKSHIAYTRNLIKMVDYAPELRSDILALVTEKLVKIDVQLQVDMEDLEDEVDDDIIEAISMPEDIALQDENDSDSETVMSDDDSTDPEMQRIKQFKETRQKIDFMIDMLFEYYAVPFTSGSIDDQESALDLLLAHFRNIILPTYRSRHSQFLLFYFSQFSPVLIDRFATTCIQIIFSKSEPTILRQYAAAYLASFVARGARVTSDVVRDVFDLLGTHLQDLRAEYESSCRGPDLRRYGPFYSTAQALLYIFCFRWRDLTTVALEEEDRSRLKELELDDVSFPPSIKELLTETIYSKLNPLKICAPHIVDTFADLTRNLGFMYVNSLIETNKRIRISSFRSLSAIAMESRFGHAEREIKADADLGPQLDAYFPFDPYKLERSKKWVEPDYIEWDEPVLDNHRDDTSNSFIGDEDEEDAEVDDETGTEDDDGY